MFRNRLVVVFCAILLLGSALNVTPAYAAGIVVNSSADDTLVNLDANSTCDLREAITNANNDAATYTDCIAGSGNDTIAFDDALGSTTVTLGSTLPTITDLDGLTIDGGGDVTVNGSDTYRIFWVDYGMVLTLANLTVAHGACTSCAGGGVYAGGTVTITNSTFSGNSEGIYIYNGDLTIANSTFTGNSSVYGGAVDYASSGALTITNSTFSGNTASGGGSGVYITGTATITNSTFSGNTGAGRGAIFNEGTLTVTNSTFSGNIASDIGGGIYNNSGTVTVRNSTFSGNSAVSGGDISQLGATTATHLYNNILANSAAGGDCMFSGGGTVDGDHNLIEDAATACGFTNGVNGNIIGSDPDLGSLTGSPAYFPLNSGSLAIDAGDDTVCAAAPVNNTSQNGPTRPQGAHCDMGSYERDVVPAVLSSARANSDPSSASSVNFTVTFSESVSGVDVGDFSLTTSGVSAASITGVTGSGATRTVSVNTGSGNGTIRLDVIDDDSIVDLTANPLGGTGAGNGNFTTGEFYTISRTLTFNSSGSQDGWVLESSETSGVGGTMNAAATTFQLGDDAFNRQYRAILSFNTAGLPDNASVQSAVLKIKQSGAPVGTNPFNILGKLWVDIRQGPFSGNAALRLTDFSAAASAAKVAYFNKTPASGWYHTYAMTFTGLGKVNKLGLTQLRLYFALDDNNNHAADYIKSLSGNAAGNKPLLVITYTLP